MTNRNEIKNFYDQRISHYKSEADKYTAKVRNSNIFRGLSFLAGAISAVVLANFSLLLMTSAIIICTAAFLIFVAQNAKFQHLKTYNLAMLKINEDERKAMDNDNSSFKTGEEFISKSHNFGYDLDIFGNNSIFQKLDRSATRPGYEFLANKLMNPSKEISEILEIQKNSQLFENEVDARQKFLASGRIFNGEVNKENIKNLAQEEYFFTKNYVWKIASIILIVSTLTTILLSSYGIINYALPIVLFFGQQILVLSQNKKTQILSSKVNKNEKAFKKYQHLFEIIENLESVPEKFQDLRVKKISKALSELANISGKYEQNGNLFFALFGQGIFLYNILINIKFENWQRKYAKEIESWFDMATEYDFLFSLSNLKYNNPDWNFPIPTSQKFILEAENAGHPLIKSEKCVRNNVKFSDCNFLVILTGANMAGKSTYLRTIGTNLILSQIGAAVCADSFKFSPVEIFTSIRTNDSVQDNESYFFAELKRLQQIIERLENGETLFIIVDEMLRGTNSKDKHDGSQQFVQKLLKYNCYGIFATHDIDIGNMKSDYPQHIDTKCFEISFNNDNLVFDYKIKDGISQNLNASYLMKKMGIID